MLKNEREREIINILKSENRFITVKELCKELYASESSIRRDLTSLENRGVIKKAYGGAELITNFSNVISFNKRYHHNIEGKKIIAKKAAKLIKDGSIIFLDQSSTSFYLANEIISRNSLTVVTNNIEILYLLSDSGIKVVSSGGFLSPENRSCLIGSDAQSTFENVYADVTFFSAKSLSDDGIVSDCTREEVTLRNSMLKNSTKKIFLCDSEKFGTQSAYKQCTLSDIDYLISENEDAKKFNMYASLLKI
ncbi:MAG: DeoR/GlpR transcriptional regulator, partial [Ruminococcaceae bacterium]|nr:DeoR/GlpR transcriptional regulator [Oscillospiraceae bacterium]